MFRKLLRPFRPTPSIIAFTDNCPLPITPTNRLMQALSVCNLSRTCPELVPLLRLCYCRAALSIRATHICADTCCANSTGHPTTGCGRNAQGRLWYSQCPVWRSVVRVLPSQKACICHNPDTNLAICSTIASGDMPT